MTHPLSKRALSLEAYKRGRWLCFDLETTGLDTGSPLNPDNRVVMVSWQEGRGDKTGPVYDHYGNILECRPFWEAVERADFLVAQNCKFEAGWLLRLGYDPTEKLWYDTMLAEKVRYGNNPDRLSLSLGEISERYGFQGKESRVDSQMKAGVCPSEIDPRYLRARCRRDVKTTASVARRQMRVLHSRGALQVALTRCLFAPILAVYESTGMCLDAERVRKEYEVYVAKRNELLAKLDAITGGVNMNSPDQKAQFFFGGGLKEVKDEETGELVMVPDDSPSLKLPEPKDARGNVKRNKPSKRFPEGRPKTDKHTIEWLKQEAKSAKQREFFELQAEYSRVSAALSKNLEFFKGVVDERRDGIFYGSFTQHVTKTHRLSGRGIPQAFDQFGGKEKSVQFQNMPNAFKSLFRARDDEYLLVESDGSQLEFRVAAFLGQDAQAMEDIDNPDFDAHVKSASVMNSIKYETLLERYRAGDKESKELRRLAKPDTFKPLYGGQLGTDEQMRWYEEFQRRYCELYETQEGWVDEVVSTDKGELRLPWGMRFRWNYYIHQRSGTPMSAGKSIKPSVFNFPVQSLATAEIIPIAAIYLFHRVKHAGLRVRWCNTVHDSVIVEIHKEDIDAYRELVKQAFTADVYRYLARVYGLRFNVPLGCETTWGTHWTEGEEEAYELRPEHYTVKTGV